MVSFIEGLEDWAVKQAIDKVIAGAIADGTIPAGDKPAFERVAIDSVNAVLAMVAQKVGVQGQ